MTPRTTGERDGGAVLFSPMVSGWTGGGKLLSMLYLRNCERSLQQSVTLI